jgi:hypothetical protein
MALHLSEYNQRSSWLETHWVGASSTEVLPSVLVPLRFQASADAGQDSLSRIDCAAASARSTLISSIECKNLTLTCVRACTPGHKKAAR